MLYGVLGGCVLVGRGSALIECFDRGVDMVCWQVLC